jgi:hypothetical protein
MEKLLRSLRASAAAPDQPGFQLLVSSTAHQLRLDDGERSSPGRNARGLFHEGSS